MLTALQRHEPEIQIVGLRPNESGDPLVGVPDRLGWEQWRLPRTVARNRDGMAIDLLYSPALGAPLRCSVRKIAHVHDLIPVRDAGQFSGLARWYWSRLLPKTWGSCTRLTVSNATVAADLTEVLQYPPERITVVPYHPDPELIGLSQILPVARETAQPADPFFVTLGSHEPRKNIELAIRALAKVAAAGSPARLVCVGGHSPHTATLQQLATELGVAQQVSFPGYVGRLDTVRLLTGGTALLFMSRYEGFGMPPLEAMSIGCPVVLSDIACLRHIYGDPARLEQVPEELRILPQFLGVDDVDGLAAEMQRMLDDPAHVAGLRYCGLAYSGTFKSEDTARALRSAFESALEQ